MSPANPLGGAYSVPTLLLDERFFDNRRGWPDDPQGTTWLDEDGYRLFARQPGQFVAVGPPVAPPPRDVLVSGSLRKVGGPPGGAYGLIVRDQGPGPRDGLNQGGRFYVAAVDDRGLLGVWRREGYQWIDIVPWTWSTAVLRGESSNLLTMQVSGSHLSFMVNGILVASVDDQTLQAGTVGVYVGGDFNEVVLEQLAVQAFNTVQASNPAQVPNSVSPARGQAAVISAGGRGAELRSGPNPAATAVEVLPDGTPVTILGPEAPMGGRSWRQVATPAGNVGWVDGALLRPSGVPAAPQ